MKERFKQEESIATIINHTVADNCDMDFIQSIHGQLVEMTVEHKNNKETDPLLLSPNDMSTLLRFGGANEETVSAFAESFKENFGENTAIPPANIIDTKKFEVKTEGITLKVNPEHSELVSTRIIDGTKCILIRADNDIVVNGIKININ